MEVTRIFARVHTLEVRAVEFPGGRPVERMFNAVSGFRLDPIPVQPLAHIGIFHILTTRALGETICALASAIKDMISRTYFEDIRVERIRLQYGERVEN